MHAARNSFNDRDPRQGEKHLLSATHIVGIHLPWTTPLMLPAGKKLCLLTNCEQWYWTRGNIYFTREYSTEFPAQCSASIFQSCSAPNRNQIILTVPWKKLSCNFSNILARLFWHMARPSYKKRDGEKKSSPISESSIPEMGVFTCFFFARLGMPRVI